MGKSRRGHETPEEDPFLSSKYAVAYVRGQQDLMDKFHPPFKSCECCGGTLTANGYIVSDYDSLEKSLQFQHYTKTLEETAALAIQSGILCKYATTLQGLTASVATVYYPGFDHVACGNVQVKESNEIASSSDAVVLVMGSEQSIEREALGRIGTLPGQQSLLISEVANASKGPVILVIMSGGGMDVWFARIIPKFLAFCVGNFPGEAATADKIFGWMAAGDMVSTVMSRKGSHDNETRHCHGIPWSNILFCKGETVYSSLEGQSYSQVDHHLVRAPTFVSHQLASLLMQGKPARI
ncbi:unnamed protein product [Fraxinus pennsylvanica]|uniref:Glycoside hydrolase family 3 C-terminal domain-containing protein n=1 Tax=Fraxinus pennsylvanica TaxID=56036 RepID=A0AAD1ZH07_9LAMI|nr:unnamed protein product [Fraxinus pennsylvanica]